MKYVMNCGIICCLEIIILLLRLSKSVKYNRCSIVRYVKTCDGGFMLHTVEVYVDLSH